MVAGAMAAPPYLSSLIVCKAPVHTHLTNLASLVSATGTPCTYIDYRHLVSFSLVICIPVL